MNKSPSADANKALQTMANFYAAGVAECGVTEQLIVAAICTAAEATQQVPMRPGYYAIFINASCELPSPYRDLLVQSDTKLIYIGIATVKQDLRHEGRSTFFRGIGAILGYRPPCGSLRHKKNKNNYGFSRSDTDEIVSWIERHLLVSWVEAVPALASIEKDLIRKYSPMLNTTHNPTPVHELAALRRECRIIASTRCEDLDG